MMSQIVRVMTVADTHRNERLLALLAEGVKNNEPNIVVMLGDFLDVTGNETGRVSVVECARQIARLPASEVVFIRGNHEHSALKTFAEEFLRIRPEFHLIERGSFRCGPLTMIGFPCLLWQTGSILDALADDPSSSLPPLIESLSPVSRTLWLMHEPPNATGLSRQMMGPLSGNVDWRKAIERFAPWLVVFGHDHQKPIKSKMWHARVGLSLCVNLGQTNSGPLHYTMLEFQFSSDAPALPEKVIVTAFPACESINLPLNPE
jgi:Icc-related predicted phosphoesterase